MKKFRYFYVSEAIKSVVVAANDGVQAEEVGEAWAKQQNDFAYGLTAKKQHGMVAGEPRVMYPEAETAPLDHYPELVSKKERPDG